MKQGTSATFSYDVKVAADVEALVPEAQDAGHCDEPGPSGLKVFYRITGDSCSFCICDEGLCDGTPPAPMTLQAGTYSESFDWDGLAWTGPSDFGNPKGEACPPGTYEVEVTAKGTAGGTPYTVTATRQLLITD
jgi:hypothetical protein